MEVNSKGVDMKSRLKAKKAELRKLQLEVQDLEDEQKSKVEYPRLRRLEGRTFKYQNSYSCPSEPADYWQLYRKVLKVNKDGTAIVCEFQTDKYGETSFHPYKERHWSNLGSLGEPIEKSEYEEAVQLFKRRMHAVA